MTNDEQREAQEKLINKCTSIALEYWDDADQRLEIVSNN